MFDPKWGLDMDATLDEFEKLGTKFYVFGRTIDGQFVGLSNVLDNLPSTLDARPLRVARNTRRSLENLCVEIDGRWDVSSTELRNKLSQDYK